MNNRYPRILLYCHNAVGVGHIARTGAIAAALREKEPKADVLIITGAQTANPGLIPDETAYIKLPSIRLCERDGEFQGEAAYLSVSFDEIMQMRAKLILTVVSEFRPDVWLVDHNPSGFYHELDLALHQYKSLCPTGKMVLGMRGIAFGNQDDSDYFGRFNHYLKEIYDLILIYVDPNLFDIRNRYTLNSFISQKIRYTGYVSREHMHKLSQVRFPNANGMKRIVVATGSGRVGYKLTRTAIQAASLLDDSHLHFRIVTGLYMEKSQVTELQELVSSLHTKTVIELERFFSDFQSLLRDSDLLIGQGGYNTLVDILSTGCEAIIVPYEAGKGDQLAHASLLANLGLICLLRESQLTPECLAEAVRVNILKNPARRSLSLNLAGAQRTADYILSLCPD